MGYFLSPEFHVSACKVWNRVWHILNGKLYFQKPCCITCLAVVLLQAWLFKCPNFVCTGWTISGFRSSALCSACRLVCQGWLATVFAVDAEIAWYFYWRWNGCKDRIEFACYFAVEYLLEELFCLFTFSQWGTHLDCQRICARLSQETPVVHCCRIVLLDTRLCFLSPATISRVGRNPEMLEYLNLGTC